MKRRDFIQSSLVTGVTLTTLGTAEAAEAAQGRVFGTPTSLTGGAANAERMMLPLSRGGMPVEGWNYWSRMLAAVEAIFSDPAQKARLHEHPEQFLTAMELDASGYTLTEPSFALLVALSDPLVQQAAESRDYASLLSLIEASGAMEKPSTDLLTQQLSTILRNNLAMIKERLKVAPGERIDVNVVKQIIESSDGAATPIDIAALSSMAQLVRSAPGELVVGAFALAVAAVETLVGVHAAAVLFTYAAVVNRVSVSGETMPYAISDSLIFNGALSKLDPRIEEGYEVASRAGKILGTPGLIDAHAKLVIRNEIAAFMRAMRSVELIDYDDSAFETIVDAIYQYGARTISAN